MLEQLVVLVEVFDGIGMVGAQTLHEPIKMVRLALLGLLDSVVGCDDQSWVGRSTLILLILLAPLCGGPLVLFRALGLGFVPASIEDRSNHLLTEGVVSGDVEQVTGGMGFQAAKLVDQGLVAEPPKL